MSAVHPHRSRLAPDDPASIGGYRVLDRLGEGGMGIVYRGADAAGRPVAIKVIRRELAVDAAFLARFAAEVANAQRVAAFCTASVLDHGTADGLPYMITEFVEGPSLAAWVREHGPLPAERLSALAAGTAAALAAIHGARLVHRDLKPANVLLSARGPRVIDFGIARALDSTERHTATGVVVGSPGWMAPEAIFDGTSGPPADVFAWGLLVAFAASGSHPHGTGTMMQLAARAHEGSYTLTGLPDHLQGLVRQALDPDPARRPSADELLVALVGPDDPQLAATRMVTRQWPAGPVATTAAKPRRRGRILAVAGAAAGLVALLAGVLASEALNDGGDGRGASGRPSATATSTGKGSTDGPDKTVTAQGGTVTGNPFTKLPSGPCGMVGAPFPKEMGVMAKGAESEGTSLFSPKEKVPLCEFGTDITAKASDHQHQTASVRIMTVADTTTAEQRLSEARSRLPATKTSGSRIATSGPSDSMGDGAYYSSVFYGGRELRTEAQLLVRRGNVLIQVNVGAESVNEPPSVGPEFSGGVHLDRLRYQTFRDAARSWADAIATRAVVRLDACSACQTAP
ncbi:serine/threonine protein kinase [Actinomadura barringtoniae]|uniref:Serine/threonine protein kinase n=1 Tax=Actinomadura barringtoniae TaxID=1427535 RepID=A0A939TEJ0_9ACTN|nr:serine/threonine-protein kinase [Actinomadura barringtoniae]MBO2453415.1 serine/threonine protein kinase [Actinomadura barringtoniae]